MIFDDSAIHLTAVQQSALRHCRQRWIDVALSATSADRETAEMYAEEAYALAGLKAPEVKIWFRSPPDGWIAADLLLRAGSARSQMDFGFFWGEEIERRIWNEIDDQLGETDLETPLVSRKNVVVSRAMEETHKAIEQQMDPIFLAILRQQYWGQELLPSRSALRTCLRNRAQTIAGALRRARFVRMAQERTGRQSNKGLSDSPVWNEIWKMANAGARNYVLSAGADIFRDLG